MQTDFAWKHSKYEKNSLYLILKEYKHPHNRLKNNLPPLKLKDSKTQRETKGLLFKQCNCSLLSLNNTF